MAQMSELLKLRTCYVPFTSSRRRESHPLHEKFGFSSHTSSFRRLRTDDVWINRLIAGSLPQQGYGNFSEDKGPGMDSLLGNNKRPPLSACRLLCRALPATDYTFYQKMREQEVTEEFLWGSRLLPVLHYLPQEEIEKVREALSLAYDAHSGQYRKSGEPFITHPVEVTRILAELQMDYESLVAGLLHDTVEDCGEVVGLEEIGFHFGNAVQRIVEGETKFSKLPTHHPERAAVQQQEQQPNGSGSTQQQPSSGLAELAAVLGDSTNSESNGNGASAPTGEAKAQDLQFLFLAMTEEVRIIIVKLADRLHNMRTMASMPPGKQRRIAQETLAVFAPLARLLGLYTIKEELEELSFKYALPQQYAVVRKEVNRLWEQQETAVNAAAAELTNRLQSDPYLQNQVSDLSVEPSKRALYGIWKKLQESGRSIRDVSEISQLRVVLKPASVTRTVIDYSTDKQLCYHVMGLIHAFWAPIPGSMKDYIATPKPNNYQSLHTTVVPTGLNMFADSNSNGSSKKRTPPSLFPIEVQIRTEEMNKLAEFGIAVESWSCADYSRSTAISERDRLIAPNGNGSNGNGNGNGSGSASKNGSSKATSGSGWSLTNILRRLPGLQDLPSDDEFWGSDVDDSELQDTNGASSATVAYTNNGNGSSSVNGVDYPIEYDSSSVENGSNGNGGGGALTAATANGKRLDPQTMSRRINWLNSIRQWQQEFVGTLTASEFVACITDDLLGQGVFVFTPSGQVMRLPKGATVVDFAYHIHTDVGNTMVAAKVNGKVVTANHELQNAEVVEVITYKGPANATIIKRHQQWLAFAHTKTARHKIAKFLREHSAIAAANGLLLPEGSALGLSRNGPDFGADGAPQSIWLILKCEDRQALLADVSNVISRYDHNITSYSGSRDRDAGLFIMEYELEGDPAKVKAMCDDLSCVASVNQWAIGCSLEEARRNS